MTDEPNRLGRRAALGGFVAAATVLAAPGAGAAAEGAANRVGRLKQSVCRWTMDSHGQTPLPDVCRRARQVGLTAIDLLYPDEWTVAQDAESRFRCFHDLSQPEQYPRPLHRHRIQQCRQPCCVLRKDLEEVIPLAA